MAPPRGPQLEEDQSDQNLRPAHIEAAEPHKGSAAFLFAQSMQTGKTIEKEVNR